ISFVLVANSQETSSRIAREAETQLRPEVDAQAAFGLFLGQLLYDCEDSITGPVLDATNASPIVITSANHRLTTGAQVVINGVVGNTAANGTFTISVVDANRFSLNGSSGNGAYTGGGVWQWLSVAPGVRSALRGQSLARNMYGW